MVGRVATWAGEGLRSVFRYRLGPHGADREDVLALTDPTETPRGTLALADLFRASPVALLEFVSD